MTTFVDEQLELVLFCAVECERQKSGERSVAHMVTAWDWASRSAMSGDPVSVQRILALGVQVEPAKNSNGFRQHGVFFGDPYDPSHRLAIDPGLVPGAIESLCEHGTALSPAEWYVEFQRIHPFLDGNGRVGAILFNWLRGSLADPVTPPPYKEA